jgi:hypothetical protein
MSWRCPSDAKKKTENGANHMPTISLFKKAASAKAAFLHACYLSTKNPENRLLFANFRFIDRPLFPFPL